MQDGSLSDIYFDEDAQTIKNHKQEVVAYWDGTIWHAKECELNDTYCKEVAVLIQNHLEGATLEEPQKLIIKIKRAISENNHKKEAQNSLIKDAAIALDIHPEDLKLVQNRLAKIFKEHHIDYERIKHLHVSTSYLMGYNRFKDLAELIDTLSNYTYEFKISSLEVLKGATTKKDYVVLKLTAPVNFYKALTLIEDESETIKFPGGFKPHISLYSVPQGQLTPEIVNELTAAINAGDYSLNHQISIKPQSVSVFNNSRLLELRQKLRQSLKD